MLSTYGSSSPWTCPLTCPELFRRGMVLPSVVVSCCSPSASSKVDASDAACHGSVSHCVAGVLVEGRACFMFDLCGVLCVPFQTPHCSYSTWCHFVPPLVMSNPQHERKWFQHILRGLQCCSIIAAIFIGFP